MPTSAALLPFFPFLQQRVVVRHVRGAHSLLTNTAWVHKAALRLLHICAFGYFFFYIFLLPILKLVGFCLCSIPVSFSTSRSVNLLCLLLAVVKLE